MVDKLQPVYNPADGTVTYIRLIDLKGDGTEYGVAALPPVSRTLVAGDVLVGRTAVPLAVSSTKVRGLLLEAPSENGADLWIGPSTVIGPSNGKQLRPGQALTLDIDDLAQVYAIVSGRSLVGYGDVVADDTPFFWVRGDETTGTSIADSVTGNPAGTLAGSSGNAAHVATLLSYDNGRALQFTQANSDSVSFADAVGQRPALNGGFSYEAWIKPASFAANASGAWLNHRIIALLNNAFYLGVYVASNLRYLAIACANGVQYTNGSQFPLLQLTAGQTYHVVATCEQTGTTTTQIKLYIDGVLFGTVTGTTIGSLSAATRYLGSADGTQAYYDGVLDEFSAYNYVLTSRQVARHYAAGQGKQLVNIIATKL